MSLRGRVVVLVALMLFVSISIYAAILWSGARRDLAAELNAASTGGVQTIQSAFEDLPRSDHPHRDLRQLVATFNGNRHLSAEVRNRSGRILLASRVAIPRTATPNWFAASMRPTLEPVTLGVPSAADEVITLRPQPASDIAALWSATIDAAGAFSIAAVLGLVLIYWVIGRALAPLAELSEALGSIGSRGYHGRVNEQGPPELRSLQRGFNAMAARLSEIDERNRGLEAQLLTIQDEERAEIARDLHDEIGPHLFAVALDADMISRSATKGDTASIPDQVQSIQSAISHMQRQVRDLIARLRPTRAAELGLEAAIVDLVRFWQARQPDLQVATKLEGADETVPEPLHDVIYRVVQESVANALRHAETKTLSILVCCGAEGVVVSVANRGSPRRHKSDFPGLGLAGMRERVHAAGGELVVERASEGWTINAAFKASLAQPVE